MAATTNITFEYFPRMWKCDDHKKQSVSCSRDVFESALTELVQQSACWLRSNYSMSRFNWNVGTNLLQSQNQEYRNKIRFELADMLERGNIEAELVEQLAGFDLSGLVYLHRLSTFTVNNSQVTLSLGQVVDMCRFLGCVQGFWNVEQLSEEFRVFWGKLSKLLQMAVDKNGVVIVYWE